MHVSALAPDTSRWFAVRIPADDDEPASVIRCLLSMEDAEEFLGTTVERIPVLGSPGVMLVYPSSLQDIPQSSHSGFDTSIAGANMRATMVLDYYRSLYGTAGGMDEFSVLCGPVILSGMTDRGTFAHIDGDELTRVLHLLHPVD